MRRETTVTIQREGRDQGVAFVLREMPAMQSEKWFTRAVMLLARSGTDVPPNIFSQGAMGFAAMGLGAMLTGLGKAPFFEVEPLMDEMMTCVVSVQRPGTVAPTTIPAQMMMQIEEPTTLLHLREEVLSLHLGFSLRDRLSTFRTLAVSMMTAESGQNTETSPDPLASASVPG